MIRKCGCKHEVQDEMYGNSNRVWNPTTKDKGWRCTVCEKTVLADREKESK